MVCYGNDGRQSDVPSSVYDALYGIDNGKIIFNETIDMKDKAIIGIKTDTVDSGAVNYKQLTDYVLSMEIPLKNLIDQKVDEKQNKSYYEQFFEYWFDCLDPNMFNVDQSASGAIIEKINDKLVLRTSKDLNSFDITNGLNLFGSHIELDETYDQNDDFTMFIVFKHDASKSRYGFCGFGNNSNAHIHVHFPPFIKIKDDKFAMHKQYRLKLMTQYYQLIKMND